MLWVIFRFVGVVAPALILVPVFAAASDPNQRHSFKLSIASDVSMEVQGQNQKINSDTVLNYSWGHRGNERILNFDSALVKVNKDGNQIMNIFMSLAKFANTEDGKTEEVPFADASDDLKKILRDSFGAPVCKLRVDENGKEVKREVIAGPGAKDFIDQGMIANARLFHPPFDRARDEWSAPTEVSMGNGGYAAGELTYKKVAGGKGGQAVKVSGTLTNDTFKLPGKPLAIKKAKYVFDGEQTYDPARREWVTGKLGIDVSFQMTAGDTPVASAKGTMTLSLDPLPGKK